MERELILCLGEIILFYDAGDMEDDLKAAIEKGRQLIVKYRESRKELENE